MASKNQDNQDQSSTFVGSPVIAERQQAAAVKFPIVGIGASAGGLEAFEKFFKACPENTGMAFVLVPHLSPDHPSMLTEILQRYTSMPVTQAVDQNRVVPNHIFIIPPGEDMALLNGVLQLSQPDEAHGLRLPIDGFFRSLADDQAKRAIGIVLSGTASDGTQGLRAIQGAGGVCIAQTPDTAKFDNMPRTAINAGYVTHILNVEAMPEMLQKLARMPVYESKALPILTNDTLKGFNQILLQIRISTSHDFSLYKKSTILRRIERRMAQHQIEDISVYAHFLKKDTHEVHALFKDLLINVTSFFRDPEVFVILKQDILPILLADKSDNYVFRVWVAGCSSGEEAYSIAIVLCELMDEMHKDFKVQIYATDLDEDAIKSARNGCYPISIEHDVPPERLRRFFTKDDQGYKIKKGIREMVVFAVHSIIKDPPFTKLDLLSCRNLLIYLEQELQNRLIPTFHYALKPNGVLFLSNSESITNDSHLFKPLNRKWKFYQANQAPTKLTQSLTQFGSVPTTHQETPVLKKISSDKVPVTNVADLSNRILLQSYAPASVTTDVKGNILYVNGDTSRYLKTPSGPMTTNVIEMAHDGLQLSLRLALQAARQGESTLNQEVSMNTNAAMFRVNFSIRLLPLPTTKSNADEQLLLISFQEVLGQPATKRRRGKPAANSEEHRRIEQLEHDLLYANENQHAIIEDQQVTNEELTAANEELQSTNEELQSSNEELETSKEELQSLNQETISVNSELNNKIEQLSVAQNDLKNLMDNVNTGILFLDYQLKIRSYTQEVVKAYRLISSDVGRPIGDITCNLQGENLSDELHTVLETLIPCEREVQTSDGTWYLARMQPYRTLDNMIDGVVIGFTNIDALRKSTIKQSELQLAQELSNGIVDTMIEPLIVLNSDLQVISASKSFFSFFKVTPEETIGHKIYLLGNGQWNIPALRQLLENILPKNQTMEEFVVEHDFPELCMKRMLLNARRIRTIMGDTELILLAMVIAKNESEP